MTRPRQTVLGALSALLLAACSSLGHGGPTNACESDDDCTSGRCESALGMCVTEPRSAMTVALEVVPSTDPVYGGVVPAFGFAPFELEDSTEQSLGVRPGIPTVARVTHYGEPVAAEVTFRTESPIPGASAVALASQARGEFSTEADGFELNLTTQLLPDRTYDITVRPTGSWASQLPPLKAAYTSPADGRHRFEIVYPERCAAEVLRDPESTETGCLASIQGVVVDGTGEPQDGLVVRMVDPVSGRTLSSSHTTGSDELEAGRFEVVFPVEYWRDQESWLFRVTPSAERSTERGPSQTFTVAPSALYEEDGLVTIRTPEVAELVTYAGWVEAADAGAGTTAARRATLEFHSRDVVDDTTGAVGFFRTTATTDDDGRFEVQLLAGTYDIIITPSQSEPSQAALGVLREERTISPERPDGIGPTEAIPVMGQLFQLPRRAEFGGSVRTADGVGMIDATVRANARGTDLSGELPPVARYARTNMSLTDMSGLFRLDLDVGVYDVVIEPPAMSNYPWLVIPDQAIASDAALTQMYELENPVTVSGSAFFDVGEDDLPVANGEIRAYAILEGRDGSTRAVQIGRTSTDADGHYTLLLPPSIQR